MILKIYRLKDADFMYICFGLVIKEFTWLSIAGDTLSRHVKMLDFNDSPTTPDKIKSSSILLEKIRNRGKMEGGGGELNPTR